MCQDLRLPGPRELPNQHLLSKVKAPQKQQDALGTDGAQKPTCCGEVSRNYFWQVLIAASGQNRPLCSTAPDLRPRGSYRVEDKAADRVQAECAVLFK